MPVRELPLVASNLAGTHRSYAEKTLAPNEVLHGKNYRQNKDGGRYPRPGYEDSQIDLSQFNFTVGRGLHSARTPKKLWLAADNDSAVKIVFVETADPTNAHYRIPFDTGLSLQTGYYVQMLDWEGDIYYANGYNTVGRIIVGQVGAAGVLAGATELDLKTGNGVRFPSTGTAYCCSDDGTIDTFTFGGKTTDQLTTVSGILAHGAGSVVFMLTTISPTYADKASVLAEWLASLNLGGDIDNPRVLEFSQFADAGALNKFYVFGSSPAGSEILGEGGEITGLFPTKNFLFTIKNTGIYASARSEINLTSGARIPQPVRKAIGMPNPRCITQVDEDVAVYMTVGKRLGVLKGRVENGQSSVSLQEGFDDDIQKDLIVNDTPDVREWIHYEDSERLLKCCLIKDGVRYVYVRDFNIGVWYDADTNKNYDVVTSHDGKTWAFDGSSQKLYIDESGFFDDDVPVESEWLTGRLGRGDAYERSKAKKVLTHGYMSLGSEAFIDFYRDTVFQFTKTVDDSRINNLEDGNQIGSGNIGSSSFGFSGPAGSAFPFRFPFGCNKKGEDFQIKVRIGGLQNDFVQFDGFTLVLRPLRRTPYKRS